MALGVDQALAEHLADNGFGVLYGNANAGIFVGFEPDGDGAPDDAITLLTGPGAAPDIERLKETHSLTIIVRRGGVNDAETSVTDERAIYEFLHDQTSGEIRGVPFARVTADTSSPVRLGRDDGVGRGRYRVSRTYTVLTLGKFSFQ